jgi:hypothetical protein
MVQPRLTDEGFHRIARALADPRRYDLLCKIAKAGDTLACEHLRGCFAETRCGRIWNVWPRFSEQSRDA